MKKLLISIFLMFSLTLFAKMSLSFTQSQDDKVMGPVNSIMPTSAITVEAWYYASPNNSTDPYRTVVSTGYAYSSKSRNGWFLRLPRSSESAIPAMRIIINNTQYSIEGSSGTENEWHHVAFSYDGSYIRFYYDGSLVDSTSASGSINYDTSDSLNVGHMANELTEPWNGYIDEVRIWDTAVSSSTIAAWKDKEVTSDHPNYSNLFIYYKFNEGSGQTASDSSGNGRDAVLGNNSNVETDDPAWYNDSPLPVVLSQFIATFMNGDAVLSWTTMSEENNNYWNLYRSISNNFGQAVRINSIPIAGNGTTDTEHHYTYQDPNEIEQGNTYYYWIESVTYAGETTLFGPVGLNIENNDNSDVPETIDYGLKQNYPNPFNPNTQIKFTLKIPANTYLEIYNIKGEKIKTLIAGEFIDANKTVIKNWNGTNENGKKVSSGLYFYKIRAGNYIKTMKMLLLK